MEVNRKRRGGGILSNGYIFHFGTKRTTTIRGLGATDPVDSSITESDAKG
jgi:hypothetical protein